MIKTKIYEPIYETEQLVSDQEFFPLNVADNSYGFLRELKYLIFIYRNKLFEESDYTGLFSPKFKLKSRISGCEFVNFVKENNGFDVYFINPFPQMQFWSYNVWMQGEAAHPGIVQVAHSLLQEANIDLDLSNVPRNNQANLAYCNFWVGNQKFWNEYVGKILCPIWDLIIQHHRSPAVMAALHDTHHTAITSYVPFIIERLFSTYISSVLNTAALAYPISRIQILENYCLNDFEKNLVLEMEAVVNMADEKASFSAQLIKEMKEKTIEFERKTKDFYSNIPHPHTGKTFPKTQA
jgi:hypothetical protein